MTGSLVLAESMFTCDSFLGHNNMHIVSHRKGLHVICRSAYLHIFSAAEAEKMFAYYLNSYCIYIYIYINYIIYYIQYM